jgi:hypothetical protein
MNLEISGEVMLLVFMVPFGLLAAVLTMPRWCIRSMGKHALWRLRDDIVDDTISGILPHDHKAVTDLLRMAEWAIEDGRSFDVLHLWVWVRACRDVSDRTRQELQKEVALAGLSTQQAERVKEYRARYVSVAITALMLGSWIGVAAVLRYAIPAAIRLRPRPGYVTASVMPEATQQAADGTWLGRASREYVWAKGRDADLAHVHAHAA